MTVLIIGGSSGLGLELAKRFRDAEHKVIITGTGESLPIEERGLIYYELEIGTNLEKLTKQLDELLSSYGPFDTVVYNAGYYQPGRISDLANFEIVRMVNVGLLGAALMMRHILAKQERLNHFIVVTSTSQWTPRLDEPVYTAVKAGLAMFARSLALDERIWKTLIAAPSAMRTKFWRNTDRDMTMFLEPASVADEILHHLSLLCNADESCREIHILREPMRVEFSSYRRLAPQLEAWLEKILDTQVEELLLSVRAYNGIKNARIDTIRGLVSKTEKELLDWENFGHKSLAEIKAILAYEFGLSLFCPDCKNYHVGQKGSYPAFHRDGFRDRKIPAGPPVPPYILPTQES
jgi:NAD(P)-dependent dehydrogenase (short-subunit alcohol dehydrogenase family)